MSGLMLTIDSEQTKRYHPVITFLQIFASQTFALSQTFAPERRTSRDWTSFETRRLPARDRLQMSWNVWRKWRLWPGPGVCPFELQRASHILPQPCGRNKLSNPPDVLRGKWFCAWVWRRGKQACASD